MTKPAERVLRGRRQPEPSRRVVCAVLAGGALALAACQPSLVPVGNDAGPQFDAFFEPSDGAIPPSSGHFTHTRRDDGSIETLVDAASTTEWRYLDLETGLAVTPSDPQHDSAWDLAFRRFVVISNGGASGMGGGLVARIEGESFASITRAPEDGWIADTEDGPVDRDDSNDSAFTNGANDWYTYELSTHALTARTDVVYIVQTPSRNYFKVQILGYYDGAGSPGFLRFVWAPVAPPASVMVADAGMPPDVGPLPDAWAPDGGHYVPPDAITVDAASRTEFTYYDIDTLSFVTPADPATDTTWDLAFQRTLIRTNSGTSGVGVGGALERVAVAYDDVTSTGTLGFVVDHEVDTGIPGTPPTSVSPLLGSWYDYDITTHTVSPKDATYIVRGATGTYARLRVWSWEGGIFRLSISPIEVRPETVEITVDASEAGTWQYLDLHAGTAVTVTAPGTDRSWDVGLSGTWWRTSSGTSGPGAGGALDTSVADFAAVTSAPTTGYVADARLTDPSPGGASYDGSAALSAWFDYDPATHVVSPRDTTFAVRLADGSLGKLEVRSYAAGVYVLGWSYAGPSRSAF